MKKAFIFIATIAIAAALSQTLRAQQYTLTDNDVLVENGIIQSCSYNFAIKDIIIPETLDGQTVTGIAEKDMSTWGAHGVFEDKNISSVQFPSTLLSIGSMAFYSNFELTHVNFQACTSLRSIGNYAFTWSLMDTVDLTHCTSLRSIDKYAFRNSYLEGIYLPVCTAYENYGWKDGESNNYMGGDLVSNHHTFYFVDYPYTLEPGDLVVENGIIMSCSFDFSYKNIAIPQSINGQTITGIIDKTDSTNGVFEKKGILALHLPETMETIGNGAFASNFLTTLYLSICTQLKSIGVSAFNANDIFSLDISGCSTLTNIGNNAFRENNINMLNLNDCLALTCIDQNAFYNNNIDTLDLSTCSSLVQINHYAFYSNGMNSINLNGCAALATIGHHAFLNNNISSLHLSSCTGLNEIQGLAFASNDLVSLDLSGCTALTNISVQAFYNNSLSSLDLNGCTSLKTIGENAFSSNEFNSFILPVCSGYEDFGWRDVYNNTFNGGDEVSDLTSYYCINTAYTLTSDNLVVEDGMIVACSYDFARNNIIIPQTINGQTITGIANSSVGIFESKGIYLLELPETIEYIGNRAFANNNLRAVDFSNIGGLTVIGKYAFYDNNIDSLDFSACPGLTIIDNSSFSKNNIQVLNLDGCAVLASIGYDAFYENKIKNLDLSDCAALSIIKAQAFTFNKLTNIDFSGCTALTTIDTDAFWSNNLTSIDLSTCTNLKTIGYGAFYSNYINSLNLSGCTVLTKIDYEAFYSNRLSDVDLSNCTALVFIGWFAFDNNYMGNFTLPTPNYPGFEYWQDVWENPFNAGEVVPVDMEYRAVDVYSGLTFSISHGTEPVDSAKVSFYTNEYYSDENGELIFANILQGEYTYVVSAEGYEDVSGELLIGTDDVVEYVNMSGASVNELKHESIRLYPNPGNDKVYIEIPAQAKGYRIDISDSRGSIILQQQINKSPSLLSLPNLNPGIYFYTIYNDGVVIKNGKWVRM